MAGKYFIVAVLFLLVGCAQVGTISGGEQDAFAPKPDLEAMNPPNASTNYSGKSIVVPFDEYFTLQNPSQTVIMVPPHAKVDATIQKKTLTLTWDKDLEPNTTYAIYMNGTVRDLTEKNDTTLQFVFSTGSQIDSLSYSVALIDAFTQKPLSDLTITLNDLETGKLISFAKAKDGVAQLNYLRQGTYFLRAINDENLDLQWQINEQIGFPENGKITVDSTVFDSIPIRVFLPQQARLYNNIKFNAPGSFTLESNRPFDEKSAIEVSINGEKNVPFHIDKNKLTAFNSKPMEGASASVVVSLLENDSLSTDTLIYRFNKDERAASVTLRAANKDMLTPDQFPVFATNGTVLALDSTKIHVFNLEDSSEITLLSTAIHKNEIEINFDKTPLSNVRIRFEEGAVTTIAGTSKAYETGVRLGKEADFGSLVVDLSGYSGNLIVELIGKEGVVASAQKNDASPLAFLNVLPGSYSFRVIRDANANGVWDEGNIDGFLQPEQVDVYSKSVKLRANWSVDVTLKPNVKDE